MSPSFVHWCSCVLAIGVFSVFAACAAGHGTASITETDTDDDGMAEIALSNEHLRIVLDKGVPPTGREDTPYNDRFVRGGWLRSIQALPAEEEFLLQSHEVAACRRAFTGLRDEFETPLGMFEDIPARGEHVRFVKIGVGVYRARADGKGQWENAALIDAPAWTVTTHRRPDGTRVVTFTQELTIEEMPVYRCTRSFALAPGAAQMTATFSLTNRSDEPLKTLWYLHPFFAPSRGIGYGQSARALVPLQSQTGAINLSPVTPPKPDPLPIWGALNGNYLAARWFAVGTASGPWLTMEWQGRAAWLQVWTWQHCFALEPFFPIDLAPGEKWTKTVRWQLTDKQPMRIGEDTRPDSDPDGEPPDVLVLTHPMNAKGKPQDDLGYMLPLLQDAGMPVRTVDVSQTNPTAKQWQTADCVVVAGDITLSGKILERLKTFVADGGGLVTNAAPFMEVADWLPARSTDETFKSPLDLWAEPRNRRLVPRYTLHLQPAPRQKSHGIFKHLPMWPGVAQNIARAGKLEVRTTGTVIARFAPGKGIYKPQNWPAVVTGTIITMGPPSM